MLSRHADGAQFNFPACSQATLNHDPTACMGRGFFMPIQSSGASGLTG